MYFSSVIMENRHAAASVALAIPFHE